MNEEKFMNWLKEHGHTIDEGSKHYEEIKSKYQKKPFSYDLAFELALDSYISDHPLENFFVNEEHIYAPYFKHKISATTNKNKIDKIMTNYVEEKVEKGLKKQNLLTNEISSLGKSLKYLKSGFSPTYISQIDCNIEKIISKYELTLENKILSKQKDNINKLLKTKPDIVDIDKILEKLDYK